MAALVEEHLEGLRARSVYALAQQDSGKNGAGPPPRAHRNRWLHGCRWVCRESHLPGLQTRRPAAGEGGAPLVCGPGPDQGHQPEDQRQRRRLQALSAVPADSQQTL